MSLAAECPVEAVLVVGLPTTHTRDTSARGDYVAYPHVEPEAVVALQPPRMGVSPWRRADRVVAVPFDVPRRTCWEARATRTKADASGTTEALDTATAVEELLAPWTTRPAAAAATAADMTVRAVTPPPRVPVICALPVAALAPLPPLVGLPPPHVSLPPLPSAPAPPLPSAPALIVGFGWSDFVSRGAPLLLAALARTTQCGHTLSTCAIVVTDAPRPFSAAQAEVQRHNIASTVNKVVGSRLCRARRAWAQELLACDRRGDATAGDAGAVPDPMDGDEDAPRRNGTALSAALAKVTGAVTPNSVTVIHEYASAESVTVALMDAVDYAAAARHGCSPPPPAVDVARARRADPLPY